MTTTLEPSPHSTIQQAIQSFHGSGQRPQGTAVTAALLALERAAKQAKHTLPMESLLGTWRLCFSAGKGAKFDAGVPVGKGFYVPKLAIARLSFTPSNESASPLAIANELQVGPLAVRFTGPARYPGKKNLLVFDFTRLQIRCFGITVYNGPAGSKARAHQAFAETPISKLPFFAFFAATNAYVAARGRGGGLAIWVNENSGN